MTLRVLISAGPAIARGRVAGGHCSGRRGLGGAAGRCDGRLTAAGVPVGVTRFGAAVAPSRSARLQPRRRLLLFGCAERHLTSCVAAPNPSRQPTAPRSGSVLVRALREARSGWHGAACERARGASCAPFLARGKVRALCVQARCVSARRCCGHGTVDSMEPSTTPWF